MALPEQLSIESTSPTTLSVCFPDGFNSAFCQEGYRQYSVVHPSVPLDTAFVYRSRAIHDTSSRSLFSSTDIGRQDYMERIRTLQEAADEEQIVPDKASLDAFFEFLGTAPFKIRTAALFLSDDGLYAAIWRNEKWRLNITFHGDSAVNYVLLDRSVSSPEGVVETSATFEKLNNLIADKDLKPLLQA